MRMTRDNSCQTVLTLPPTLPKEIEDALKPFFTYTQNQQQASTEICDSPINSTMLHESMSNNFILIITSIET